MVRDGGEGHPLPGILLQEAADEVLGILGDAAGEAEEAQDTLGYQVRFTDALQTKIDELHALASQVDPVAADAIKSRPN